MTYFYFFTSMMIEVLEKTIYHLSMNTHNASKLFDSLSSPVRLYIFQHLAAQGSKGMVAGDLARELDIAPNNLSFHLKTLLSAQLVHSQTEGRFIRYYANLDLMITLVDFLTDQCYQHGDSSACQNRCQ